MAEAFDTLIVGAGQAGLATSFFLGRAGVDHLILEKGRIGEAWRSQRWDSFTLVTPNWSLALPGWPYRGEAPDGFMARAEFAAHLEAYAASFGAPVRGDVEVHRARPTDAGYEVATADGVYRARNLVVATSTYQRPRRAAVDVALPPGMAELHASQYRNPGQLAEGAVLVIGSGQSGAQIADELNRAGRRTFLAVGEGGRLPRRYRGRDAIAWQRDMGYLDRTVDLLDTPARRFKSDPHTTGQNGGRDLDLRRMGQDGVTLLGRLGAIDGTEAHFADDLAAALDGADAFARRFAREVDAHIRLNDISAPSPEPVVDAALAAWTPPTRPRIDLMREGIATVVWATGFAFDFAWIEGAPLDDWGYPATAKGVSARPGLYFVGLNWLHKRKSGIVHGVGEDAEWVARHILMRTG